MARHPTPYIRILPGAFRPMTAGEEARWRADFDKRHAEALDLEDEDDDADEINDDLEEDEGWDLPWYLVAAIVLLAIEIGLIVGWNLA
jgi:hypothetical protein